MFQVTAPLMATLATTAEQVTHRWLNRIPTDPTLFVPLCKSVCVLVSSGLLLTDSVPELVLVPVRYISHSSEPLDATRIHRFKKKNQCSEDPVTQDFRTVGCSQRRQADTGKKIKLWWMTSVFDFQTSSLHSNTLLGIRQTKANTLWADGSFTD